MSQEKCFITYNSLISICILSEDYDNSRFAKFLYAEENLEHSLNFKICKKAFLDYTDIKGSLFYIRNIEECITNYSFSEKQENVSKELGFLSREKIHKNTNFYLQHMTSRKFVSIERTIDNKYILKLKKNIDNAANFYLKKVNEKRNSREYMNFDGIFNLSIYIEDDDLFYYIKDDINPINGDNTNYNIIIEKDPTTNFCLFNQNWFTQEKKEIYSGQIINIIFSSVKNNIKEELMLSVLKKEKKIEKRSEDEELIDSEEKLKYDEYYLTGIPYTNKLDKHIINNSFWIIEEDTSCLEEIIKQPIGVKTQFRIRNLNVGLYLKIKELGNMSLNNYSYSEEYSDLLYEFYLVDESTLDKDFRFEYNFLFLNSSFGILSSEVMDEGEYILKGVYHKLKFKDWNNYKSYYKPLALNMKNNNRLEIKQEDDFIFKIKKVDLQKGIQVTYVKKIMDTLDKVINDNVIMEENNIIINESIKFFLEYLLNIDYSFRDEKYESNIPMKERQTLLFEFNIVELVDKSLEYYLKKIEKEKDKFLNEQTKKIINDLLINIIKFFKNLSLENEDIKQTIYIISLNKLLKLCDIIFHDNITDIAILINFIFELINDSEALQDYFLGGGNLLEKQSSKKANLNGYNLDGLLREHKLLGYIEKNYNYLLYYEKLIGLNKVQYKRKEIEFHVKNHIESVKKKTDKNKMTYKQIIEQVISDLIKLIKKYAILIDKFNDKKKEKSPSPKKRLFRSIFRKSSVKMKNEKLEEERKRKEEEDKYRRDIARRSTTRDVSNIILEETDRQDTTNKFLDGEEEIDNNIDSNNKNNLINIKTIKEEDEEEQKSPRRDEFDRKDNKVNLMKTFTLGFNLFKKKKAEPEGKKDNKFGGLSFFNRIKSEFDNGEEDNSPDKTDKKNLAHVIFDTLTKKKSKLINRSKTRIPANMRRASSLRPLLSYKDFLIKLAEIYEFIQFFSSLDLDKSLFINEYFLDLIKKESDRGVNLDPTLFVFFTGDKIKEGKNCFLNKNIVNLYLFYLYNMFFPSVKSNLKEKIKANNIKGADIVNEINDNNDEEDYSDIDDESKFRKDMMEEFNLIDDKLCILYSIFQLLINQYTKTIFKLFNLKCNFYLNFLSIDEITKSKSYFCKIIKNLLSKIVFLNKEYFQRLYKAFISNPSLLNEEFDLDNRFLQNNQNQLRLSIKNTKKMKMEKFSKREAMLIEYLYFFVKKCDEIKYLYEKMIIYKYIKNLIDYEKSKLQEEKNEEDKHDENELLEGEPKKIISMYEKLSNLSNYLNKQKLRILRSYEKLLKSTKKYSVSNNSNGEKEENKNDEEEGEKDKFTVLKIKEKSEFITQSLKNYEIKKFFNNIIYMESKSDNIISDKSLKKLRRVRKYYNEIEKELLKLKLNSDKYSQEEFDKDESNIESLKILNQNLGKISNEQGHLFNLSDSFKKGNNILTQMLICENKSFYKKIRFTKMFERMVQNITFFQNCKDKNILIYCSYLLKIFIQLKNFDDNFRKNIDKFFKLYAQLIYGSLKCTNEFSKDIMTDEELLYLNISYLGIEAFLIILKSSKLQFVRMKYFTEKIFSQLRNVFYIFQNRKYKIIYQILYTYAVSRILLFLNKQRSYDASTYDLFFNLIYPIQKMKDNISFCFETINNSLDKEHILSRRNSEAFLDDNSSMIEESEESFSKYIHDEEKEGLIVTESKSKIISMDLSLINKTKINKTINKKNISNKPLLGKDKNISIDYIRWDNENELNKLSFYLNFISVYVIYLNDKNILIKEENNDFPKKEIKVETNFSFNTLSGKIKTLLDTSRNYEIIEQKDNSIISQIDKSILKEEKNFFGEKSDPKNIDYKFFSVLLESILVYRANLKGQNIEIQIKKAKNGEDKPLNAERDQLKNSEELFINKNDNDNLIFYYYNPEFIDIILLEKILNEIELKEGLTYYCLDDFYLENNNSYLYNELFKEKKAYRIIQSYYDEEYNLIQNYFIKNNMELLIKKILKSFDSNDFNKISEMENYFYKRMGEIYSNTKISGDSLKKNDSLVDFLLENELNIRADLKDIDILSFFDSLVYIYQKFKKSTCIIYYKIGFELLIDICKSELNQNDKEEKINKSQLDLELMTNTLILLFSSETNINLIENKKVFAPMLSSIKVLLYYILSKGDAFIFKNIKLLKEFFNKLNFIFDNLSLDFAKIVSFMKKPNKTKDINKFDKKKKKLENILDFLIIFLEYKKIKEDILTEEIFHFTREVVLKVIKLLFILLELPSRTNFEAVTISIKFLFKFIKGPDIKNINLLFSLGFFDLVVYVIRDIDYYNIFLNYLNKENLHEVIDYYATAECKIIKIFIIYYNTSHGNNNIEEFEKLQHWYEDNFDLIKKKLKRLYYMSRKEMEEKEYNIDKMLLFIKENDDYDEYELKCREGLLHNSKNEKAGNKMGEINEKKVTEEEIKRISEKNKKKIMDKNEKRKMEDKEKEFSEENINKYCIIKFDLLLAYYSLYNYHIDLATKTELSISKKGIFLSIFTFILNILVLSVRIITIIFYAIYFLIMRLSIKDKTDVDLLQDLKNIEIESQIMDEQNIINFLRKYIKELEISLKNKIYKVYFPMLNKANTIEKYKEEYYKVEQIDSSDFINYLLSNYDSIHIRAKEYVLINKIINLPILRVFFKNLDVLGQILIIFSLLSNLLIMLSYNNFVSSCDDDDEFVRKKRSQEYVRLECPHLFYEEKYDSSVVIDLLKIFGIIQLILQTIIFLDYIVRIFSVEQVKISLKYKINNLKNGKDISSIKRYIPLIIAEVIIKSIFNFRSLYYILSIVFICLGLVSHPFFYCITLLEFVNRIQLMQTVLKAMYEPLGNILITLLMFIILEYLFSLFAISYFTYHFPNLTDTKNFLKTFMRTIEQTFKQDGGVGTYLNEELDPDYTDYTVSAYFNVKFFFDLLFFLLILSLIFQLFLSTIIDHFNETRENNENFKEGLETNCSVCGMEREKIEKIHSNNKNAFEKHITYFHNAFNYIYYLMYLQSTNFKDSVIENGVWSLHLNKNLSYLPKNKCFKEFEKNCWKILDNEGKEGKEEEK